VENGREEGREGKEKGEKAKYFIQKDTIKLIVLSPGPSCTPRYN
jgi:hypothetical protein